MWHGSTVRCPGLRERWVSAGVSMLDHVDNNWSCWLYRYWVIGVWRSHSLEVLWSCSDLIIFGGCFCSTPSSFCKDFQVICIQFYTWLIKILPKLILNIRISYDLNIWHVLPISKVFLHRRFFENITDQLVGNFSTLWVQPFQGNRCLYWSFSDAGRGFHLGPTSVQQHVRFYCWWNPDNQLRLVVYPIIYRVLYSGAGFLPSTVCQMLQLFFSLAKPKYEDLCGAILWVSNQAPVLSEEAGIQSKAGISIFLLGI